MILNFTDKIKGQVFPLWVVKVLLLLQLNKPFTNPLDDVENALSQRLKIALFAVVMARQKYFSLKVKSAILVSCP